MQQNKTSEITEAEYLAEERKRPFKSEYFRGEVFAMVGASEKHNLIVANLITTLNMQLKGKPCRVYPSDMRLKIEKSKLYTYPDVMVLCGERQFVDEKNDTLLNPEVIIEVLSDSTESYDRGVKFEHYRTAPSLKEYILISQNDRKMKRYYKN